MLRKRDGRIVNITSVAGRVSMPFYGAYCGSKHAMESISDSLRRESNLEVVMVEPGVVKTGFNQRARDALEKYLPESYYAEDYERMLDEGGLDGIDAEQAAEKVVKAVTTDRPKRRHQVPLRGKLFTWFSMLPHALKDRIFEKLG